MATPSSPKVELGKETRKEILDALRNIKTQISAAKQRESTPADVAADVLASGGGPFSAMKEALAFKAGKAKANFKRRMDPLNIVNRMTGGSKLATVLAGKMMGRSETSIRSAAGLQAKEEIMGPSPVSSDVTSQGASAVERDKALELFDRIAKAVAIIALRVTDIAVKMKAVSNIRAAGGGRFRDLNSGRFVSGSQVRSEKEQAAYLRELTDTAFKNEKDTKQTNSLLQKLVKNSDATASHLEEMKDASAEAQYESRFAKKSMGATRVGGMGTLGGSAPKTEQGWLSWIGDKLSSIATGFLGTIGTAFVVAGKKVGGFVLDTIEAARTRIVSFLEKSWEVLGSAGKAVKEGALGAFEATKKAGRTALNFGRNMIGMEPIPEPVAPTPKPPTTVAKPSASVTSKAIPMGKESAKEVVKKVGPKLIAKTALKAAIPAFGLVTALKSLAEGDLTQAVIDAGMGAGSLLPGLGSAAAFATGLAGTLANQAYKEMYGIDPLSDPDRATRLPEIVQEAEKYVSESLKPVAEKLPGVTEPIMPDELKPGAVEGASAGAPAKVSELPVPAPTSGMALAQAADLKASAESQPRGESSPAITSVKMNNVSSTTVHQSIASARSGESSYLRSVDRNYAVA